MTILGNITGNLFDLSLWTVGVDDDSTLVPQFISVSQNFLSRHLLAKVSPCMFIESCQDAIQKKKKSHTHTKWNETLQYCEIDLSHLCYIVARLNFLYFKKCYYSRSVLTLILTSENINSGFTLSNVNGDKMFL